MGFSEVKITFLIYSLGGKTQAFLENGIGCIKQIGWNYSRDENLTEKRNTELDEKVILDFEKVLQRDIAQNPNLSRTANIRIYLKDIDQKHI